MRGLVALAIAVTALAFAPGALAVGELSLTYDAGKITLRAADGTTIGTTTPPGTAIPAGNYEISFHVASGSPLIDIEGPGISYVYGEVEDFSQVEQLLPNSTYTISDDNTVNGPTLYIQTTSQTLPPAPSAPTPTGAPIGNTRVVGAANVVRGTLRTTLGVQTSTLVLSGKAVSHVAAGRYRVVVRDTSAKEAFTLARTGHAPVVKTTAAFVGTRTVTVRLVKGTWSYGGPTGRHALVVG